MPVPSETALFSAVVACELVSPYDRRCRTRGEGALRKNTHHKTPSKTASNLRSVLVHGRKSPCGMS
jgi:hypothetical protein